MICAFNCLLRTRFGRSGRLVGVGTPGTAGTAGTVPCAEHRAQSAERRATNFPSDFRGVVNGVRGQFQFAAYLPRLFRFFVRFASPSGQAAGQALWFANDFAGSSFNRRQEPRDKLFNFIFQLGWL